MKYETLTHSRLCELLNYDPETGIFTWKTAAGKRVKEGLRAGWDDEKGYRKIQIDGKTYREHQLAWFYVNSKWPAHEVDHKDGIRNNNRISNVREATRSENRQNLSGKSNGKSGIMGCSWHKKTKKWQAYIQVGGKWYALGYFDKREDAGAAYLKAKKELHSFQPVPRDMDT
jgi:hypothetical protein